MHPSLAPPAIDAPLLGLLLEADEPVTLAQLANQLANQLQTSPENLQQSLKTLQACGCTFEERPDGSLKLNDAGLGVWCDYLQAFANPESGAQRLIEVYPRTSSTQDAIVRLIDSFAQKADGALAVADYQESGRGRLGRAWVAPSGACLTFSTAVIITPDQPPLTSDRLMLATSVAVAHALEELPGIPPAAVRIKWPNDILIGPKKLAGILVEQTTRPNTPFTSYIIGIGINTHITPDHLASLPELADKITSLHIAGAHTHRLPLLARTLTLLERYIHSAQPDWLRDQWRQRSGQLGRHITLAYNNQQTSGTVLDIDPQHGLILQTDEGPILHLPAATTSVVN